MSNEQAYIIRVATPAGNFYVFEIYAWGSEIMPVKWTERMDNALPIDSDSADVLMADFAHGIISDVMSMDIGGTMLLHPMREYNKCEYARTVHDDEFILSQCRIENTIT